MSTHNNSEDLIRFLADLQVEDLTDEVIEAITLLLADFLAAVKAYQNSTKINEFDSLHGSELAAALAIASSSRDMDDVDWHVIHHPGSVILPAVIAVGLERGSPPELLRTAIHAGYRSAAIFSGIMSPAIRQKWHSTSMAGAIGAVHAVSELYEFSPDQKYDALSLTCANLGGLSRAGIERNGAASFNRASAASLSLLACRSVLMKTPFIPATFDALMQAWDLDPVIVSATGIQFAQEHIGIQSASLRLFPVSGYMQAAIQAMDTVLNSGIEITDLSLHIAPATYRLTVEDKSPYEWVDQYWWDLRATVSLLEAGHNLFSPGRVTVKDLPITGISVHPDPHLTPSQARIEGIDSEGNRYCQEFVAPGAFPFDATTRALWEMKCSEWLNISSEALYQRAHSIMQDGFPLGGFTTILP